MTENYDEPLSERERVDQFIEDLDSMIDRYLQEYDILLTSVVGILTQKVHYLLSDSYHEDVENEDDQEQDEIS